MLGVKPYLTFSLNLLSQEIRLINICLSETYSRVRIGLFLSDAFLIHCGLNQRDVPLSSLFNFTLEFAIWRVNENIIGLEMNGKRHLVYADDVNMLGENLQTVRENTENFIKASKDIALEVNSKRQNV